MTERYLFRGKRLDNGAWETGNYVAVRQNTGEEKSFIADKMTGYHTPVDPNTVGQCTGLRDKNGTLIFEGDIISCRTDGYEPEVQRVAYENYSWELRGPIYDYERLCDYDNKWSVIEVIGNIHDNPELLEV